MGQVKQIHVWRRVFTTHSDDKMSPPLARLLRHIALRVRVRVHAFYTLRALVGMRGRNYCAQQ